MLVLTVKKDEGIYVGETLVKFSKSGKVYFHGEKKVNIVRERLLNGKTIQEYNRQREADSAEGSPW